MLVLLGDGRTWLTFIGARSVEMMRRTLGLGLIPSDDTLRERISTIVREPLLESGFTDRRLDFALEHFGQLGYHSKVLVNDATALLPAIGYRALDDSVHGYAVSDDLLAHLDVRAGNRWRRSSSGSTRYPSPTRLS